MTFSIAAMDCETGSVGAAVASVFPAVGAVCPWVSEDVAVLTQDWDSGASYGQPALNMVGDDISLPAAADTLISERTGGNGTQIHGVELTGSTFTYAGAKATAWAGHMSGDSHTVAGNTLVGEDVVAEINDAFTSANGPLYSRLLTALEAGEKVGGDKRGDNLSAALLVHAPESKLYHNLRVDLPDDPIGGHRTGYETAREYYSVDTETGELIEVWGEEPPDSLGGFQIKY